MDVVEGLVLVTSADEDDGVSGINMADCSAAGGVGEDVSIDECMTGGVDKDVDVCGCMAIGAVGKDGCKAGGAVDEDDGMAGCMAWSAVDREPDMADCVAGGVADDPVTEGCVSECVDRVADEDVNVGGCVAAEVVVAGTKRIKYKLNICIDIIICPSPFQCGLSTAKSVFWQSRLLILEFLKLLRTRKTWSMTVSMNGNHPYAKI